MVKRVSLIAVLALSVTTTASFAARICQKCGAEWPDEYSFCENCGEPLVPLIVCPRCGKKYPEGSAVYCTCGYRLGDEAPAAETQKCPQCGYENKAGLKYCVACGAPLDSDAAEWKSCPRCGRKVRAESDFCSGCNYSFVAEKRIKKDSVRTGFVGTAKFGLLSLTGGGGNPPGFYVTFGKFVSDQISTNGGLGYESWPNGYSVPLFFRFKMHFLSGSISPTIYADVGYHISKLKDYYISDDASGVVVAFGGGADFYVAESFALSGEAGYEGRTTKVYTYYYPDVEEVTAGFLNSFRIAVGTAFSF
jgi:hypothetical protein